MASQKMILLAVFLFGLAAADDLQHRCRANELWFECGTCEGSCKNPNPFCTLECKKPGCYCPAHKGFIRDNNGNCVPKSVCNVQHQCPKNELWFECGTCEGSCKNPRPICTLECKQAGCYCPTHKGFVRGPQGDCIPAAQCNAQSKRFVSNAANAVDSECPKNEVWLDCGTCEGNCLVPNPICTRECKPPRCYCPAGFVRFGYTGACIPLNECPVGPAKCGVNERWTNCGTCDSFCQDPWGHQMACTMDCKLKCECLPGFVRGWDGKCIKKTACTLHPDCARVSCPKGSTCNWAPQQCSVEDPNCPQVTCLLPKN